MPRNGTALAMLGAGADPRALNQPTMVGPPTVTTPIPARLRHNAEILSWQSRTRITVACIAAIGELLLLASPERNALTGLSVVPLILASTVAYVALIQGVVELTRQRGVASWWMVLSCAVADVAFVFAMVAGVSEPQYWGRILVFVFFAVYLTTCSTGRTQGVIITVLTVAGYLALTRAGIARGAAMVWREELWSLGVFVLSAAVVIGEHGSLNERLARIVHLFTRAEEGDFSRAYDEDADHRPDGIARVGQAYNRVRVQLASMVLTDPLTGCLNRRGFDQALAREVARATRSGSELAMLALDIDHFKAVNDTMGHPAGDTVLRQVGELLRHMARQGDIVSRTGGEEFSILLPDTSAPGAFHLATRICAEMRRHGFGEDVGGVSLTVSIGVSAADQWDRRATASVGDGLKGRADEALYVAKRTGRDRARIWSPTEPEQLDLGVSA